MIKEALSILDIVNEFKVLFFTNVKTIVFSGISICLLTGFYLYNTPKQYVTYAKIKVLEEEETSAFVLGDMLDFSSGFKKWQDLLANEIEVIKSKNILEFVIEELDLTHSYAKVGLVSNENISYSNIPFSIEIAPKRAYVTSSRQYNIDISESQNRITNIKDEISTPFTLGTTFVLGIDTLKITKTSNFKSNDENGGNYLFTISSGYNVFQSLKTNILLKPITDMVLGISIKGKDPILSVKIIESLLKAYDADGKRDSKLISEGTLDF